MATAKHRAIDLFRRQKLLTRKHEELGYQLDVDQATEATDFEARLDDDVGDDLLRLDLHGLSSRALDRSARRADASAPRRPEHRGNRARVSRARADDRAAHRPREAGPGEGARAVRGASRRRSQRAPVVGPGSRLSDLQRGLCRERRGRLDASRAVRGRAAARPRPGGTRARGIRGARAGRPDGDSGVAVARAGGSVGRAHPAARPGSIEVGSTAHSPRIRVAGARRSPRRPTRPLRAAGRDRRLPRSGPRRRRDGLGPHRRAVRRSRLR